MPDVSAVIPNWNRKAMLESLLGRLAGQTRPPAEILVVDNGSTDGSAEAAEKAGARVIRFQRNAGFAAAVNAGIRECRCGLVAILNNDVEPEADWLERLSEAAAARPDAWFATGKILDAASRGTVEGTWDLVSRAGCSWRAGNGRPDGPAWNRERVVNCAPFTALVAKRELFEKAGLLDERFESYLEDVDFGIRCARLRLAGLYVPEARAYHHGSATLGRWHADVIRRISRNQVFLVARHYPERWWLRYGWAVFVGQALWGLTALRHGTGIAWLAGKVEGVRRFGELRHQLPGELRPGSERLEELLVEGERELHDLQRESGLDFYWRVYFALT